MVLPHTGGLCPAPPNLPITTQPMQPDPCVGYFAFRSGNLPAYWMVEDLQNYRVALAYAGLSISFIVSVPVTQCREGM